MKKKLKNELDDLNNVLSDKYEKIKMKLKKKIKMKLKKNQKKNQKKKKRKNQMKNLKLKKKYFLVKLMAKK